MTKPIKVLLLYGGRSGEHEISLRSAASVMANLSTDLFEILPVGMDKKGCFFVNDYHELLQYKSSLPVVTPKSRPLESIYANGRLSIEADVVFPVVHGPLYEDGCLQGLLDLAGVAYVGCGVLSSAIGMDKDIARRLVSMSHVKAARYRLLCGQASALQTEQLCREVIAEFGFPLFVKPSKMGSSVGIHKAQTFEELTFGIADARRYDDEILVEEFIVGREIELSVLENSAANEPPLVSLPGEIVVRHPDGFYSYKAKYLESEATDLVVPAALDDALIYRLQDTAKEIFTLLKCRGMARIDFFVNDIFGDIYFNEINTLPGFTSISMYPRMWEASGLPYRDLLERLITLAIEHHQRDQQLVTHYQ